MSSKAYKKELLIYLGRYFQDTTDWELNMLPPRIIENIGSIKPFLQKLESDGYINILDRERVVFKITNPPPNPETYLK